MTDHTILYLALSASSAIQTSELPQTQQLSEDHHESRLDPPTYQVVIGKRGKCRKRYHVALTTVQKRFTEVLYERIRKASDVQLQDQRRPTDTIVEHPECKF